MRKFLSLALCASTSVAFGQYVAEFSVNPAGSPDFGNQYIELRGLPNQVMKAGTWLLAIDGGPTDGGGELGELEMAIPLDGLQFGSNGVLLLQDSERVYISTRPGGDFGPDAATNIVRYTLFPGDVGDIPNDSVTIAIVKGGSWAGVADIDVDDDGTIDPAFLVGVTPLDAMCFRADNDLTVIQQDYADDFDGLVMGPFSGAGEWEPDIIYRFSNGAVGGPAVGSIQDTWGWCGGDRVGGASGPYSWDSLEILFFDSYGVADPNVVSSLALPSPGWANQVYNDASRKVSGQIVFGNRSENPPLELMLTLCPVGQSGEILVPITLDANGNFSMQSIPAGVYSLSVFERPWLRKLYGVIDTRAGDLSGVNISLINGDVQGENEVNLVSFAALSASFGKSIGDDGFNEFADLDGDGEVNLIDFAILSANFGIAGDECE